MGMTFMYPEHKFKAVTMSYDDGVRDDIRLIEIFNKYGIKGSFHINSALLGDDRRVAPEEVKKVYAGHEVSCHSAGHPFPDHVPRTEWVRQVWEDRRRLEELAGYPVTGMSYPYNVSHKDTVEICRTVGIECARHGGASNNFLLPQDFLYWTPTCHHKDAAGLIEKFKACRYALSLFFIWGHAYEFGRNPEVCSWEDMENICRALGSDPEVWYATNLQICRYIKAVRSAVTSCDGKMIYNPSGTALWFVCNGEKYILQPGETISFD